MDQFTFELLVVFVESLALAHDDDKSLCEYYSMTGEGKLAFLMKTEKYIVHCNI